MTTRVLVVLALLLVALALIPLDYGFYNPPKGVAAAGSMVDPVRTRERELLQLVVTEADVARFKGKVTLTALSDLYGTKDSLPCSVKRTYGSDNMASANWPIQAGSTATLCLN